MSSLVYQLLNAITEAFAFSFSIPACIHVLSVIYQLKHFSFEVHLSAKELDFANF